MQSSWAAGLALVTMAMVAGACATPFKKQPSSEQLAEASAENLYGDPPADHEALVREYLRRVLFDPYSVQDLTIGPVQRAWWFRAGGLLANEHVWWGWRAPVTYNAKNRYGAYTGLKTTHAYFKDGRLDFME